MRFFAVSIRDRQADCYTPPMFSQSLGMAERGFRDQVNRADENNVIYKHPEDFELFHVGYYDDNTGAFESVVPPSQIAVGSNLVSK